MSAIILPLPVAPSPARVTLSVRDGADALLSIERAPTSAAHSVTPFLRLTRGDDTGADAVYDAPRHDSPTTLTLTPSSSDMHFRLDRLITAGT